MTGYIKLHRKLLGSAVFQNEKVFKVFMWCLLRASHKNHEQLIGHQVINLKPGQLIYGRTKASQFLKIKPSTVNDCMNTLKNLQIIDIKPNNKFSVVTVVNWGFYQTSNDETDNKPTTNRQQISPKGEKSRQQNQQQNISCNPCEQGSSAKVQSTNRQQTDNKQAENRQQSDTNKNVLNNKDIYIAAVNYLNHKAGTNYKPTTKSTRRLIDARVAEGLTEADFKTVIDKKVAEWQGTDMAKYLRPETLFGAKFESYLNQSVSGAKNSHPEGFEVIR